MQVGVVLRAAQVTGVADVENALMGALPLVGVRLLVGRKARRVFPDGAPVTPDIVAVQGNVHPDLPVANLVAEADDKHVMEVAPEHQRADKWVQLEEPSLE